MSKDYYSVTREKWEETHKPTCNHYPCRLWRDVHWHIKTCKHGVVFWNKCDKCKELTYIRIKDAE